MNERPHLMTMPNEDDIPLSSERCWAMSVHLLTFFGLLIPGANLLVLLLVKKRTRSAFVRRHARSALRFQGSMMVWSFFFLFILLGSAVMSLLEFSEHGAALFLGAAALCAAGLFVVWSSLVLRGAVYAWQGKTLRYPFLMPAAKRRLRRRRRYLYRRIYRRPAWRASADCGPSITEYRRLKRLKRQFPEEYPHPLPPITMFGYYKQRRAGKLSPYLAPFEPPPHRIRFLLKRWRRFCWRRRHRRRDYTEAALHRMEVLR